MNFSLTPQQLQTFRTWSAKFTGEKVGAIGGAFTFSFTHTSVGIIIKVTHFKGETLDLTDYDTF